MMPLTEKQESILEFIKQYFRGNSYTPTIKEIAVAFGYASDNAAREHVNAIKRKGYITTTPKIARSIVVVDPKGSKELKALLYYCDGLSSDYCQGNYGNAGEWLRHINEAYQDYQESIGQ